jgi:hypothetical protein
MTHRLNNSSQPAYPPVIIEHSAFEPEDTFFSQSSQFDGNSVAGCSLEEDMFVTQNPREED